VATKTLLPTRILMCSLELAEESSWDEVSFSQIAARMQIKLVDLYKCYHDKNALIDAWFEKANVVMLQEAAKQSILELNSTERMHHLIMSRFKVLGSHHRITREMIFSRLKSGHISSQITGLSNLNRTAAWLYEAMEERHSSVQRLIEEKGILFILANTTLYWLYDDSPDFRDTREFLAKELGYAEKASNIFNSFLNFSRSQFVAPTKHDDVL